MFLAATPTTAAARVNQVSVEFQLFFITPFFPLYLSLSLFFSLSLFMAFASYIGLIACKALLVPLCKLYALKLCSCLRQKARIKRDIKKSEREGELEKGTNFEKQSARGPSSLYLASCLLACVFSLCVSSSLLRCFFAFPFLLGTHCVFFGNVLELSHCCTALASVCVWYFSRLHFHCNFLLFLWQNSWPTELLATSSPVHKNCIPKNSYMCSTDDMCRPSPLFKSLDPYSM